MTHCGGPREQVVLSCDWPLTSSLSVYCSKLCFSGPPRLQEERQVCGWGGACSLQGLVDEGYWGSLAIGNSPAGWLKKLMKVREGFRVLFPYGGPRECGVPLGGTMVLSENSRLCFKVPLRLWEYRRVEGNVGTCSLQGPVDVGYCGNLPLDPLCIITNYVSNFHRDHRRIVLDTVIMRIEIHMILWKHNHFIV